MRSIFKRAFCLHEWVKASPLKYGSFARVMWVCKKCGKTTFYPDY